MITLYRVANCDVCDDIQEKLRDLVVAHTVVDVEKEQPAALAGELTARDLPIIADGEQIISGEAALQEYLDSLTREVEQWRKFQSDVCYIDDEGEVC